MAYVKSFVHLFMSAHDV